MYVGQKVMCFQSTPATGKKGLLHKFYTLNMCLYFTALFCLIYFYTSILLCKKNKTTANTVVWQNLCHLVNPILAVLTFILHRMITLSSRDFENLMTCMLIKSFHNPLYKVKKNGLKIAFFLHSWKVKVFGYARFSSDSIFSGEQGQTDILKA